MSWSSGVGEKCQRTEEDTEKLHVARVHEDFYRGPLSQIFMIISQSAVPLPPAVRRASVREITVSLPPQQTDTVTLGKPLFADTVNQSTTWITQQSLMQVWLRSAPLCYVRRNTDFYNNYIL